MNIGRRRAIGLTAALALTAAVTGGCGATGRPEATTRVLGRQQAATTSTAAEPAPTAHSPRTSAAPSTSAAPAEPTPPPAEPAPTTSVAAGAGAVTGEIADDEQWTATAELVPHDGSGPSRRLELGHQRHFEFRDVAPGDYRLVLSFESPPAEPSADGDVGTALVAHQTGPFAVGPGHVVHARCGRSHCQLES